MHNLCKANNSKTNADVEDHEGGYQDQNRLPKRKDYNLRPNGNSLYHKDMECENWNYEIWSYYLREGRKEDQIGNIKEQYKIWSDKREIYVKFRNTLKYGTYKSPFRTFNSI